MPDRAESQGLVAPISPTGQSPIWVDHIADHGWIRSAGD